jgi:hypothetical protein
MASRWESRHKISLARRVTQRTRPGFLMPAAPPSSRTAKPDVHIEGQLFITCTQPHLGISTLRMHDASAVLPRIVASRARGRIWKVEAIEKSPASWTCQHTRRLCPARLQPRRVPANEGPHDVNTTIAPHASINLGAYIFPFCSLPPPPGRSQRVYSELQQLAWCVVADIQHRSQHSTWVCITK